MLTQCLLVGALLRTDCARPPGRRLRELQRVGIGQRQRQLNVTAAHRKLDRGTRARLDEGEVRGAVAVEHPLELEARAMNAHAGAGSVRRSLEVFRSFCVSPQVVTALVEGLSQTSAEMADRASSVRVIRCADAVAAWHSAWLASFGQRFVRDKSAWRALDAPHFIYFAGITLQPDAPAASVGAAPGTVCDSWSSLDLAPSGFRQDGSEAWFYREPGPLPVEEAPPELELVQLSLIHI